MSPDRDGGTVCYSRLFHKVCREEYGTQSGPSMLTAPQNQVEGYNNKCQDRCAIMDTSSKGALLVALSSPLMKKVHQLKHSGELCFIDSSGNMDRERCRVFLLKDKILQRTKAFNPPQLFDLLTSRLETYYETRIVDVALGRWESFQRSKFLPQDGNIAASQIQQIEENKFLVEGSKNQTYVVDMELELCSCPAGQTVAPCKHQAAVTTNYRCLSNTFLPQCPEMRAELLKLTSGEKTSLDFLQPLRLSHPTYQLFKGATPEPSTDTHEQQQMQEPDGLTEQQAQPSTSAAADGPHDGITHSGDVSLVEDMMEDMKGRCQDPLFTAGLVAMAKQYALMKTNPSKLLSVIHTFGKSGSLTSKRATSLRRAARRQGPMIGCQPTSVARRKAGSGSKRRLSAGRPVKRPSLSSSVALNSLTTSYSRF
ncbi:uncharacterized protein PAE49_004598 isoform 2-T3 [Odontesthes bonariensis]|uniref:uncharacterized protein LOC142379456 isoform X2 n=1 Tax=Odontesthes bonariensis TaxID=219752 RepID=UPI003F585285